MTIGVRKRKDGQIEILDTSSKIENKILATLTIKQTLGLIDALIAMTQGKWTMEIDYATLSNLESKPGE